jgi:hypothetical protein
MKVHELIARLQKCYPDAEVRIEYDYDGEDVQEDMDCVTQSTIFGAGDEGDDVVFVTLSH